MMVGISMKRASILEPFLRITYFESISRKMTISFFKSTLFMLLGILEPETNVLIGDRKTTAGKIIPANATTLTMITCCRGAEVYKFA
jgi:hypothetical protein